MPRFTFLPVLPIAFVLFGLGPHVVTGKEIPSISPVRVAEMKTFLASSASLYFYTPPYAQGDWWDAEARRLSLSDLLAAANAIERTPPPELPRELFDDYRLTGNRATYEKPFGERTRRLGVLLYAEGFVRNGNHLPAIERETEAILREASWAVPAHIPAGADADGLRTRVDLAAATRAWSLASTDYLLGDRLSKDLRLRIRKEVSERVVRPVVKRLQDGNDDGFWWMTGNNNWTPICYAGVMGAALLLSDSPEEKALLLAAFEQQTRAYIEAFGPDGYCEEGIGYWSYGFGHYVMGAELVRLSTGGAIDLMSGTAQRKIALFDTRLEIATDVYPAFGDASPRARTPITLRDYAILRLGAQGKASSALPSGDLMRRHPLGAQLYAVPFKLALYRSRPGAGTVSESSRPARDWFPRGGALIVRHQSGLSDGLSAAMKGSHNGVSHNHNDIGSYVVVVGSALVLADLGVDTYVKDTFGARRYTSAMMNSFGHPVPLVAGMMQKKGADARAVTLRTEFTPEHDIWEMDIVSAYDVPELQRLTRTFIHENKGCGSLRIVDRVKFSSPRAFGTAVILQRGQYYSLLPDGQLYVEAKGRAVTIRYESSAGPLVITEAPLLGIVPTQGPKGIRLGIDFKEDVLDAEISVIITPVDIVRPSMRIPALAD